LRSSLLQGVEALLHGVFEFVEFLAEHLFLIGRYLLEPFKQIVEYTFATEVFDAKLLYLLSRCGIECGYLAQVLLYGIQHRLSG
jgi:hypothetical protein